MSTDQPSTDSVAQSPPAPSKLQLENQSLKRRLVQYAATLEKLTTHAKREIDQSTRARDEALSRAADASNLRHRVSVMQSSLTAAQSARDSAAAARTRAEARVEQLQATLASLQRRLDDARYDDSHVASMREELASLQKQLPSLRRLREQDAARASTLQQQLHAEKSKSAEYDALLLKLQQIQTHNSQLATDRDAAHITVSNIRRSESSLTRERDDLSAKLRDSDDMNDMLRQQLHQTQDRLRLLEQRLNDAQTAEIQYQNAATDQKKQADQTVHALRTELDTALKQLGERNTLYEDLQQKHARSVDAESAIAERDAMRANVQQLQVELDQSTEMLTRAAIDALADKAKIRKLEDALDKTRSLVDGERQQRGSSDLKVTALNQQIASLEAELDQLRSSKRALADECHKYQLQIHERDSIVANKNRALEEIDTDRNDRAFQVDRLKLELSNTKNGLVKKEADLVRITTEYEEMCAVVRTTNKELDVKHAELNALRKDMAVAKDNLSKLAIERDQLKVSVSELQATRSQVEELSNMVAAKDEELSSMKRWCTTLKAEAGESVREKKRLTDMLADVSGDLKRANQELELLRNMKQDQEALAQRISQIGETSTREFSIMRQSQSEQAQVLAKSTVEQYQDRLAEMQKSARHEIADTVSSQLRDHIMPHLMRAVDAKARHLVHSLAKHVESFTLDDTAASYEAATKDYTVPKPPADSRAAEAEIASASLPPSAPQSTSRSLFVRSATESTAMSLAHASHGGDTFEYTAAEATAEPSAVTSERSAEPLPADSSVAPAATRALPIQPTDDELVGDIDPVAIHNRLTESYKELLGDHSLTDPAQTEGFRDIDTKAGMDNVSEFVQVQTTTRQVISSAVQVPEEEVPNMPRGAVPLETAASVEDAQIAVAREEEVVAEAPKEQEATPLEPAPVETPAHAVEMFEKPEQPAEDVVGVEEAAPLETAEIIQSREVPLTGADVPQGDEPEEEETTPLDAPEAVESAETPAHVEDTPEDGEPKGDDRTPLETTAIVESREILESAIVSGQDTSVVEEAALAEASIAVETREIPSVTMEDLHTAPVDSREVINEDETAYDRGEELEIVHQYVPKDGELDESFEEAEDDDEYGYGEQVGDAEHFQDALDSEAPLGGDVASQEEEQEVVSEESTPLGEDSKPGNEAHDDTLDGASPLEHDGIEEEDVGGVDQYEAAPQSLSAPREVVEDTSPLADDVSAEDEEDVQVADDEVPLDAEAVLETIEQRQVVSDVLLQGDDASPAADHEEGAVADESSTSKDVEREDEAMGEAVTAERDFALDAGASPREAVVAADQSEVDVAVDEGPLDDDVVEGDREEPLNEDTVEHDEAVGYGQDNEEDSAIDVAPLDGVAAATVQDEEEALTSSDVDSQRDDGEVEKLVESAPVVDNVAQHDHEEDYTHKPLEHEAEQTDIAEDARDTPLTIPIASADIGEAAGVAIATHEPTDNVGEDSNETHDPEFQAAVSKNISDKDDAAPVTGPPSEHILLGSTEDVEEDTMREQGEDEEQEHVADDVLEVDTPRDTVSVETEDTEEDIAADEEPHELVRDEDATAVAAPNVPEDTLAQETVEDAEYDSNAVIEDEPREHNLDLGAVEPVAEEAVVIASQVDDDGSARTPVESHLQEVEERVAIPESDDIDDEDEANETATETARGFHASPNSKDVSEDVNATSEDKQELLDLTAKYGDSSSQIPESTTEVLQEKMDAYDTPLDHTAHTEPSDAVLENAAGEDGEDDETNRQDITEPEVTAFDAEGKSKGKDIERRPEVVEAPQLQGHEHESKPSPLVGEDAAVVEGGAEEDADNEYIEEVDATREDFDGDEVFEAEPPVLAFATLNVVEEDEDEDSEEDYESEGESENLNGQAHVEPRPQDEVEELDLTAEGRPADLDSHSDLEEDYEGVIDPDEIYGHATVEELVHIQQVDPEQSPIVHPEDVLSDAGLADVAATEAVRQHSDVVTGVDAPHLNKAAPEEPLDEGAVSDMTKSVPLPTVVVEPEVEEQPSSKPSIPDPVERVGNITSAGAETADDAVEGENILRA